MRAFLPRSTIILLCVALCFIRANRDLHAQDASAAPELASLDFSPFSSPVGQATPNVELPSNVPAEPGELTVYADFNAQKSGSLPLYIVNRTNQAVPLESQDGDLYVRLEYRNKEGKWVRAQPCSQSDCGLSYMRINLPAGNFLTLRGTMPTTGVKARVRFASFVNGALVSQEIEGFYSPEQLGLTRLDAYSRFIPHALSRYLREPWDESAGQLDHPEEIVAALRLVQVLGANPYYQKSAGNIAGLLEKKPQASATDRKAAASIRKILAEPWSAQRNPRALRDRCMQALSAPNPKSGEFGNPDNFPEIVGQVLFSGEAMSTPPNLAEWKPVVDFVLKTQKPELLYAIAQNESVADEFLPNDIFEKHIFDENPAMQAICAQTLSRRGRWDRLAELGWKLGPSGQIFALKALAYPKAPSGSYLAFGRRNLTPAENKFWQHCLNSQPIQAATVLYSARSAGNDLLDGMIHQPLREALLAEVRKSHQWKDDFLLDDPYQMRLAVMYLGECHQKEDTEVLQALLDYRGYAKEEGWKSDGGPTTPYVVHRFIAREAARDELKKREIPVPEDLVLQQDVTPQQP